MFAFIYISLSLLVCIYVKYTSFAQKDEKAFIKVEGQTALWHCSTSPCTVYWYKKNLKKLILVCSALNFMYSMLSRRGHFGISETTKFLFAQSLLALNQNFNYFTGGYSEPMQMLSDIIAHIDALVR